MLTSGSVTRGSRFSILGSRFYFQVYYQGKPLSCISVTISLTPNFVTLVLLRLKEAVRYRRSILFFIKKAFIPLPFFNTFSTTDYLVLLQTFILIVARFRYFRSFFFKRSPWYQHFFLTFLVLLRTFILIQLIIKRNFYINTFFFNSTVR